jgi:uncharacterized SAM-binding protein YcdF (DUF218 family)
MKLAFVTLFLPLGLTLLLLAGAIWELTRKPLKRGKVMALVIAAFALLYALSTPAVGRALGMGLFGMVNSRALDDPAKAEDIIVLTGGIVNAGPIGWIPNEDSYQRMAVAYELQRMVNLRMPVIVSGGHTHGVQAPSEAAVTAGYFANIRSEITPTELEEASTDTDESAMQLQPVLAKREAHNVFLVTSDVHMLRALATFRARGVDPIAFPALSLAKPTGVRALLPSASGLKTSCDALYEYYALGAYLLTGKVGWSDVFYHTEPNTTQAP